MSADDKPELGDLKPDLNQIISAFGMQALMSCGKIMNPMNRKYETDLMMAKYHIAVLEVLQEKTAGNITEDEKRLFEDILHQARMAYMDAERGTGKVTAE